MNKKLKKMIEVLLRSNHSISSSRLAEIIGVSQRTIKRYIKEIPDSFSGVSFTIQADKNGYQLIIDTSEKIKLLEVLGNLDGEENDAVGANIFLYLVFHGESTIEEISDYFYYARNTIAKRIEDVRAEITQFDIQIRRSTKGLTLIGKESALRKALFHFLELDNKYSQQLVEEYFHEARFIEQIHQIIIRELIDNDSSFSQEQILLILKNILIVLIRAEYPNDKIYENDVLVYKNYMVVNNIAKQISEAFQLEISEADLFYLSILFGNTTFTEEREREIRMAIFYCLEKLDKQYNEQFLENSRMTRNLQSHAIISIQRLTIGLSMQNPLKEMIKTRYFLAYEYATFFSNELSKILSIQFTDEEISYFALHFQTYLEEKKEDEIYHVMVICENGVGTSSLVRMQLEARFTNLQVLKVIPRYLAEQQDYRDIDFIISTHHIQIDLPKEIIYVSPVLTEQDFKTVHRHIRSSLSTGYIKSLFHKELFICDVQLKDKEEVLHAIGNILQGQNRITTEKQEQLLEREKYAPTDVVSGVALPHFVTSGKSFFFFMKLQEPILWSTEQVSYIFFGGINVQEKESKKLFPYLIKKFQQETILKKMNHIKTYEEFIQILVEG
ncbi:BglG family transcription antiterminator [Candidatus Enterococcus willemsii]|uniref:PTS system EIIA component n=1 Tax=Candidatus Enterococcus willemsii TaxID=1857215 RepID=A0ABQ6YZ20_9ENTE|nr:PTS sugar transporter subunit IIA [Enterococcus sp. CU12B]KAF1303626.1 hypothetical protein BAU17_06465 [Enterococcus sp. CU12B]